MEVFWGCLIIAAVLSLIVYYLSEILPILIRIAVAIEKANYEDDGDGLRLVVPIETEKTEKNRTTRKDNVVDIATRRSVSDAR